MLGTMLTAVRAGSPTRRHSVLHPMCLNSHKAAPRWWGLSQSVSAGVRQSRKHGQHTVSQCMRGRLRGRRPGASAPRSGPGPRRAWARWSARCARRAPAWPPASRTHATRSGRPSAPRRRLAWRRCVPRAPATLQLRPRLWRRSGALAAGSAAYLAPADQLVESMAAVCRWQCCVPLAARRPRALPQLVTAGVAQRAPLQQLDRHLGPWAAP